jgi:hypothetical protein
MGGDEMCGFLSRQPAANPLRQALAASGLGGEVGEAAGLEELCQGAWVLGGHDCETGINV